MGRQVVAGPGSLRVGRFIGRLGVVSVPAVKAGLDLDQRVVRRHVAKLEAAGWLARAPWRWGEGSVVWLTGAGVEGAGLGGVRAVESPPAPTTIAHGVLVGWSAARAEHRGRGWKSARELALDPERWAVPARCERGYTQQLPDLAVWLNTSKAPGAVVAESGGRREDRQKMILEGWRDAIWAGRYTVVRYDCASPSVAHWITRLAKKVGLTSSTFTAVVQTTAEQMPPSPPPPQPPSRRSTRRSAPPNRCERAMNRTGRHRRGRNRPHGHCDRARPGRYPRRSPRRPKPPQSASGATASSLASTTRSPDVGGAADPSSGRAMPLTKPTPATKEDSSPSVGGQPRDEDRRLAPALATDLAPLGEDHATRLQPYVALTTGSPGQTVRPLLTGLGR